MMGLPAGTRIWIAAGVTDMRAFAYRRTEMRNMNIAMLMMNRTHMPLARPTFRMSCLSQNGISRYQGGLRARSPKNWHGSGSSIRRQESLNPGTLK
jgi:hypothetical protein